MNFALVKLRVRAVVGLAAAVASSVAAVPVAEASFPGRDGLIAFAREVPPIDPNYIPPAGAWTIWAANPRTGRARELTHVSRRCRHSSNWASWTDQQPAFSASGRLVLYVHTDECDARTREGIYLIGTDGARRRLIRPDYEDEPGMEFPAFAPSGRSFAFDLSPAVKIRRFRPPHRERFLRLPAGRGEEFQATWSSTGSLALTLAWDKGPIGMATARGDFRSVVTRSNRDAAPDWSPSAHRLVFHREKEAGGDNLRIRGDILTAPAPNSPFRRPKRMTHQRDAFFPVWSPDGRSIAYVRSGRRYGWRGGGWHGSLWRMRSIDGGGDRLIARNVITDKISWQPRPRR